MCAWERQVTATVLVLMAMKEIVMLIMAMKVMVIIAVIMAMMMIVIDNDDNGVICL